MAAQIENWDDEEIFFSKSTSTVQTSFSSRQSLHSDSNAGDEQFDISFALNDENSTKNAIMVAKQKGVPIPENVPPSALSGTGTIKRIGKKMTRQKVDDDWGLDIDLPTQDASPLKLNPSYALKGRTDPTTPERDEDDFDLDWAEGSLGTRNGGTKKERRTRSSSTSAMSPSMGSFTTTDGEEDGFLLPDEPLDLSARLQKVKAIERDVLPIPLPLPTSEPAGRITRPPPKTSDAPFPPTEINDALLPSIKPDDASLPSIKPDNASLPPVEANDAPLPTVEINDAQPAAAETNKSKPQSKILVPDDDDDMLGGLDVGTRLIDPKKPSFNRNIKITSNKITVPPVRSTTTLSFTDKPTSVSRIPRPAIKSAKLDPVYEPGAVQVTRTGGRAAPTTTSSQLLRAKRSAPVLRSQPSLTSKPSIPFLPAGVSGSQSHHVNSKVPHLGLRRDSNPDRGASPPPPRPFSRMSRMDRLLPESTPSRAGFRRDEKPSAIITHVTKPYKSRDYGNGSELDMFDDLPTSATKENQFIKEPVGSGKPGHRPLLRAQTSLSRLALDRNRTQSPMPPSTPTTVASTATGATTIPQTPRGSGIIPETPRFARDTAASRNAREQRLGGNARSRDGPLSQVQINWKTQVALRNPHLSPTAQRGKNKGDNKKPQLITWSKADIVKNEKGMTYNLALNRWEGNENEFDTEFNGFYQTPNNPSTTTLPLRPTHTANHSHHHHTSSIPSGLGLSHPEHLRNQPSLPQLKHQQSNLSKYRQDGSPPRRPALISGVNTAVGVQVQKGMVFDQQAMKWIKVPKGAQVGFSPSAQSIEEPEDDPFAGIDDLPDERGKGREFSVTGTMSVGGGDDDDSSLRLDDRAWDEAFDIGEGYVRRTKAEEEIWRKRTTGWVGSHRDQLGDGWRWRIFHDAKLAAATRGTL
ncbi:hypothetical protein NA57DRAFT_77407 [Rhizodiscina lignyota]|uniref:Cytokinesis regulator n=1 Tax=Rhizodiscina lignyota TaxID=1504668 RepID=A0A9P4M4Q1_9PEZI|nr:hypothetical protein NA57DRAFT_77407 [Rhizodiscina lignyota]